MTSKKRRRPSNKGNDSVGVISTLHWVGWLLLGTGLMFATQEDFLPSGTTSELAAMAAVVMGILYLATQGVQLFKFVQQQWAWCNEAIAGIAVLFGATLFASLCWVALAYVLPSVHARGAGQAFDTTVEARVDDGHARRSCRPRLVGPVLEAGLPAYICVPQKLRDSTSKQFTLHGLQTDWGFLVLRVSEATLAPKG